MSKDTKMMLIVVAVLSLLTLLYVLFFNKPAKPDIECTTDYVQRFGEEDCKNMMEGNEQESDVLRERPVR